MPIFQRPPLETLAPAKDRWTPLYLEHGRIEVDDSSIQWIAATGLVCPIPVATLSALILGPGTTITHAAVKAAAQCNCPLFWLGEDGLRFYAFGITPNHDNSMARIHATAWASPQKRNEIARRMFRFRFSDVPTGGVSITQLRGMEGRRVKQTYEDLGRKFGVTWKGRDYNPSNWSIADNINRALSAATASHYALTAAVCCSMGFIPQLGFVHQAGTLPFIYDAADLYKHETSWPAAFEAISIDPKDDGSLVRKILKRNVEQTRMLRRMPDDLIALFKNFEEEKPPRTPPAPTHHRTMTVLVANDVPPAIRGHLKRWFIEPRANVFVGTLNPRTHRKVLDFIARNAPSDFGFLSISSHPNCQGYLVERVGPEGKSGRRDVNLSGIDLIAESWIPESNHPF